MSARGLPGRRVEENRAGMTATAVAGDRVTDPALCSTGNSSTRSRRPAVGVRLKARRLEPFATALSRDGRRPRCRRPRYDRPMSKPVLAVGLLAVMGGAWYWALLPSAPAAVSRRPVSPVVAGPPRPAVPAVRLDNLAVEAASRPMPRRGRAIPSRTECAVATADDSHVGRRAPAAPRRRLRSATSRARVAASRLDRPGRSARWRRARAHRHRVRAAWRVPRPGRRTARTGVPRRAHRRRWGGHPAPARRQDAATCVASLRRIIVGSSCPARATHQVGARRSQLRCRHGLHPVFNCF